jgi:hypothetical protein
MSRQKTNHISQIHQLRRRIEIILILHTVPLLSGLPETLVLTGKQIFSKIVRKMSTAFLSI